MQYNPIKGKGAGKEKRMELGNLHELSFCDLCVSFRKLLREVSFKSGRDRAVGRRGSRPNTGQCLDATKPSSPFTVHHSPSTVIIAIVAFLFSSLPWARPRHAGRICHLAQPGTQIPHEIKYQYRTPLGAGRRRVFLFLDLKSFRCLLRLHRRHPCCNAIWQAIKESPDLGAIFNLDTGTRVPTRLSKVLLGPALEGYCD